MSVALDVEFWTTEDAPGRGSAVSPRRLRAVPDAPSQQEFPRPAAVATALRAPVTALRAPAGAEAVAPVRLTRRGVVVLAALVAALGGALLWIATLSAPAASTAAAVPATVTVGAGDTVWSIAQRYTDGDPGALVARIEARNHLVGFALTPGQVLRLR